MAIDGFAGGFTDESQVYGYLKKEGIKDEDELTYQSSVFYGAIANLRAAGQAQMGAAVVIFIAAYFTVWMIAVLGLGMLGSGYLAYNRYQNKKAIIDNGCERYRKEFFVEK